MDVMKSKKGSSAGINMLLPLAVIIGVTGLVTAFILQIMGDVQDDMTASSAEYNATGEGITAVAKITGKLGIIVTVVLAVVVIALLIGFMARKMSV